MTLTRTNVFGSEGHLRSPQRSGLDAFFAVEGTRDDAAYNLDTFPIVHRKDEDKCYPIRLNPPLADPHVAHPAINGLEI